MDTRSAALLSRLLAPEPDTPSLSVAATSEWLGTDVEPFARVSAAALIVTAGPSHPDHARARAILDDPPADAAELAAFYCKAIRRSIGELARMFDEQPGSTLTWDEAIVELDAAASHDDVAEAIWRTFCPQASGIRGHEATRIEELRTRRTISIHHPAADPITDPARESPVHLERSPDGA